jgi:hypothetical protein
MLNVWHKQMTSSFGYMTPRPEVEPDHVLVHFQPETLGGEMNNRSGSRTLGKEEVRRLDLMVEDAVTINQHQQRSGIKGKEEKVSPA